MTPYTPDIARIARIILSAYGSLSPATDEDGRVNDALVTHLRNWLESGERVLTSAAQYSINRFVEAELDYTTSGNRGMGRMTDYWPRFGGKYRGILSSCSDETRQCIKAGFADEIVVGYFFAEYLIECFSDQAVPRAHFEHGSEAVFEQWIPTIYSAAGPPQFDARFAADNSTSYYDVKGLWGHAVGDAIHEHFSANGIPIDDFAQQLIRQFFDAGVMLRVTEMRQMSADEHADIVTGGGFSAAKAFEVKSRAAVDVIEDLYEFRNMPHTREEMAAAISAVGLTLADVQSDPDLAFEAGIARNFRRACEALSLSISPHQSLTLAKHIRVGADHYRTGIPLTDHERSVAIQLRTIHLRAYCEKQGEAFSDEHARDCERSVRFGERGLHIGHKIGEASGCFQVVALVSAGAFCAALVMCLVAQ